MPVHKLTVRAFAKLNLTLEVLGRRDDGYHEIASVLQTVSIADVLRFEPAPGLTLACSDPALESPDNLALRAARLLQQATGADGGAAIRLEKHIPPAAGLGGGSADAAATLWALDRFWRLALPLERLEALAKELGSDVPFFIRGGTAVARGRGELLTSLPPPKRRWFLVLSPRLDLPHKTHWMYSRLAPRDWSAGRVTEVLAAHLQRGSPIREAYLYNAFDTMAPDILPDLHEWRRRLLEVAPSRPHVAGSGPSLYIPLENEAHGHQVTEALAAQDGGPDGADVFVVHTVPRARETSEE